MLQVLLQKHGEGKETWGNLCTLEESLQKNVVSICPLTRAFFALLSCSPHRGNVQCLVGASPRRTLLSCPGLH